MIERCAPSLLAAAALLAAGAPAAVQDLPLGDASAALRPPSIEWDARAAEHLLNRAGFGARPEEIRRWVAAGPEALVEHLLAERERLEPFYFEDPLAVLAQRDLTPEARRQARNAARRADRVQMQGYLDWTVGRMLAGADPLRERMTLFWHGFFTSGFETVRRSRWMIEQDQLLRAHATGSYASLLKGILRDPAMLDYLDNDTNRKGRPNENLAREVMELFSLGEGHYTERDVKEAARALTGHAFEQASGAYRFFPRRHDAGSKVILGVRGRHGADELAQILLARPECARWVAGRLIEYLEGVAPEPERLERYAALLREGNYELAPLLRTLFLDPDFYREQIVGARVSSPIDYLVGTARRLGMETRPRFLLTGATLLGQQLFEPPNVKGWEEGEAWLTTATLLLRGNLAGMLLGVVSREDLEDREELMAMADAVDEAVAAAADETVADAGSMALDADDDESEMDEPLATDRPVPPPGDRAPPMTDRAPTTDRARPGTRGSARDDGLMVRLMTGLERARYRPSVHLAFRVAKAGLESDEEIVDWLLDELLAIEPPSETRALLVSWFARERAELGLGRRLPRRSGEQLLRRAAHLVLSLPEAQLL